MTGREVPVQPKRVLVAEFLAALAFLASTAFFAYEYQRGQALEEASSRLALQSREIARMEEQLQAYRSARVSVFSCIPGRKEVWQEVSARFEDLDFFSLLEALETLEADIASKGHEVEFVLSEMEMKGVEQDSTSPGGRTQVRLQGYMVDFCQEGTR